MKLLFFLAYHDALDAYVENRTNPDEDFGLLDDFLWSCSPQGKYYWYDLWIEFNRWERGHDQWEL